VVGGDLLIRVRHDAAHPELRFPGTKGVPGRARDLLGWPWRVRLDVRLLVRRRRVGVLPDHVRGVTALTSDRIDPTLNTLFAIPGMHSDRGVHSVERLSDWIAPTSRGAARGRYLAPMRSLSGG
jgi:hypothetical protein